MYGGGATLKAIMCHKPRYFINTLFVFSCAWAVWAFGGLLALSSAVTFFFHLYDLLLSARARGKDTSAAGQVQTTLRSGSGTTPHQDQEELGHVWPSLPALPDVYVIAVALVHKPTPTYSILFFLIYHSHSKRTIMLKSYYYTQIYNEILRYIYTVADNLFLFGLIHYPTEC